MGNNVTSAVSAGQKWLFAIDPFSDLDISRVIGFAKVSAGQAQANLRGVYVLAPESLNWTGEFSGPWMDRYLPLAKQKAQEVGQRNGVEIDVVSCSESGLRPSVKALVTHAKDYKANLILLSTHARSGIERWTLGSYAETLILSSSVPVMVINPQHELPKSMKNILVPTDLSDESEKFVMAVGAWAKTAGSELTLFYKQPDPLDPMIQQGVYAVGGGWVSVQSYLDSELGERRKQLEKLQKNLADMGVRSHVNLSTANVSLIEAINKSAGETKADVIAVLTKSGPMEAAILGSVARGLVRSSQVPVYIRRMD